MIIELSGIVIGFKMADDHGKLEIKTNSGVGYRVYVPSNYPLVSQGDEISIYTSFQVKEDSQELYGFTSPSERDFFETLISVSGVGPKIGLSILSMYGSDKVKELILAADHISLSKVKGLGPKGSKKIILELAGILTSVEDESKSARDELSVFKELRDALKTLGFGSNDINGMIDRGKELYNEDTGMTIEVLLQKVLRNE